MPPNPPPPVLVCGVSGSQGGAVASQFCSLGWTVHATARDLSTPAAQALIAAYIQLTEGHWDNDAALTSSLAGCEKMFLCTMPDFRDMTRERWENENIVRIVKESGVTQVVSSTSLGLFDLDEEKDYILPGSFMERHLRSKKTVENAVNSDRFSSWTFLRPTFFMANFMELKIARYPEPKQKGSWTTALTPESLFPIVDHCDTAKFAVAAFKDFERFHDRAIGMASQLLTLQATFDILGRFAGRSFRAVYMSEEEVDERAKRLDTGLSAHVSMRHMARHTKMDGIASVIQPTNFEEFLKREVDAMERTWS